MNQDALPPPRPPPASPPALTMNKTYIHYYCFQCKLTLVMEVALTQCPKCGGAAVYLGHVPTVGLKKPILKQLIADLKKEDKKEK